MKLPAIGMRTIKSGIGAFLCAILGQIGIIDNPFFAVGACVVSMQNTIKDSFEAGFSRAKGTLVGGFFGFLFALFFKDNIFMCSIGIMVAIYVCNLLKLKSSVQICGITYASIAFTIVEQNALTYSIHRTLDTTLGVFVGVFVNYIISRPDLIENIVSEVKKLKNLSISIITDITTISTANLSEYEGKLNNLIFLINKYSDEYTLPKKEVSIHDLDLVIFKFKEIKIHIFCLQKLINKENLTYKNQLVNSTLVNEVAVTSILEGCSESQTIYNYHLQEIKNCITDLDKLI